MKLVVARHGNTFGPGDKVVWAGSRNDLPLVEKGFEQAVSLAAYLKKENLFPCRVYASPLQRTHVFAQKVLSDLSLDIDIQTHLALEEIDYGPWTGLSNEEVAERFSQAALEAWNERSEWPDGWGSNEEKVKAEIIDFVERCVNQSSDEDVVLCVSSNGKIRYFLNLISGLFEEHSAKGLLKVKTGSVSVFEKIGLEWKLVNWNITPP